MNFNIKVLIYILAVIILTSCGKDIEVTSSVVEPSYIMKVSKYRSCCGHKYGNEKNRSMKHYFTPKSDLPANNTTIPLYAPFDGNIINIQDEEQRLVCYGDAKRGKFVDIMARANPNQYVRIFHVNPMVETGKVKSGDFIGYADLRGCENSDPMIVKTTPDPIDVAFHIVRDNFKSVFEVMSDSVSTLWEGYGVSKDNIILSSDYRDAAPCDFSTQALCSSEAVCLSGQTCN